VFGRALDATATPIGPASGTSYTVPGAPDEQLASASFDGSRYLVVHERSAGAVIVGGGTWVDPAGQPIGERFDVASGFTPAGASTASGRSLVAYVADFDVLDEGRVRYKIVAPPGLGVPDAGPIDAGAVDGGPGDAGVLDADVVDAGGVDAVAVDGGSAPAVDPGDGCDCGVGRAGQAPRWPALLLLVVLLRRRYSTDRVVSR
jgi:hypothetical protein